MIDLKSKLFNFLKINFPFLFSFLNAIFLGITLSNKIFERSKQLSKNFFEFELEQKYF